MTIKRYVIAMLFFTTACGEGIFDVEGRSYEPKIVIDGYLVPGSTQIKIYFRRNLPLNDNGQLFYPSDLVLTNAQASLTDVAESATYPLSYNADSLYYTYSGTDLTIGHGKTYRLEVSAVVNGKSLSASSETTTPNAGFSIDPAASVLDSMEYNAKDSLGNSRKFRISFHRSPGTDFYLNTLEALDASVESFIYSPVNIFWAPDTADVADDLTELKYSNDITINTPLNAGTSSIDIEWYSTWFYGDYRVVLFAGDRNMRDFFLTYGDVQEADGNLHEPVLHIDGDGIGVFGSALSDTVMVRVLRRQ